MQPSEFWRMAPRHFWWLVTEDQPSGGKITKTERDDLLAWVRRENSANGARSQG